jgi:hypothetical protein
MHLAGRHLHERRDRLVQVHALTLDLGAVDPRVMGVAGLDHRRQVAGARMVHQVERARVAQLE